MGFVEEAKRYTNRGWPVFPLHDTVEGGCSCGRVTHEKGCRCGVKHCESPGKHPRTEHGLKDATTDREKIEQWWKRWPTANLAIRTGEVSGITVIDLDDDEVPDRMRDAGIKLPETYCVKTPRGWHLYTVYNPNLRQDTRVLDHVDVRNDGGYVVAPPSVVNEQEYRTVFQEKIEPWKGLDDVQRARQTARDGSSSLGDGPPGWVSELLRNGAPEGTRNDSAASLAGYFRSKNHPEDITQACLVPFAERCNPPFSHGELKGVIRSVYERYEPSAMQQLRVPWDEDASPPESWIDRAGRIYLRWETGAEDVQAVVERVQRRKDGLHALVGLWRRKTQEDDWQILSARQHVNFWSTSSRTALRQEFDKLRPVDGTWHQRVQQMAQASERTLTDRQEIVTLADEEYPGDVPYVLYPVLEEGQHCMLFAAGGTGKSFFSLASAISVARGEPILPGMSTTRGPTSVLYLDWETDKKTFTRRFYHLCDGVGIERPRNVQYIKMFSPLPDNVEWLQELIADRGYEVVIIDSVHRAAGDTLKDDTTAVRYNDSVSLLQEPLPHPSVLSISHVTKAEETQDSPIGATQFRDGVRTAWKLAHSQEQGQADVHLGLFPNKANNDQLHKPLSWKVKFEDRSVVYVSEDLSASEAVGRNANAADQIQSLLKFGSHKLTELYDEFPHLDKTRIRKALERGEGTRFVKLKSGKDSEWGLRDASQNGHQPEQRDTLSQSYSDSSVTPSDASRNGHSQSYSDASRNSSDASLHEETTEPGGEGTEYYYVVPLPSSPSSADLDSDGGDVDVPW